MALGGVGDPVRLTVARKPLPKERRRMRNKVLIAIAAGMLLLGACASRPQPQEITLTAKTMTYDPSTFEATAGVPVELTFVNQDALEHDFTVLEIPVESVSEADRRSAENEMQMGAGG